MLERIHKCPAPTQFEMQTGAACSPCTAHLGDQLALGNPSALGDSHLAQMGVQGLDGLSVEESFDD